MRKTIILGFRLTLGFIFFIYGLNGFLNIIPLLDVSTNLSIAQVNLYQPLREAGFFFPLVNSVQVIIGILLMLNFFVAFSLILLLPITLGIFFFHFYLGVNKIFFTREMIFPIFIVFCHVVLLIINIKNYKSFFLSSEEEKKEEEIL